MSYTVDLPDGRSVEFPDEVSREDAAAIIQRQFPRTGAPKPGIINEAKRGFKQFLSSTGAGISSFGGQQSATDAGLAANERAQRIAAEHGASPLERVKDAYNKNGFMSAAGEFVSGMPAALAGQAPQLAAGLGGARVGALAGGVFGPVGAVVGGALGAGASMYPGFVGENLSSQAAEAKERGESFQADRGAANLAAAGQTALEVGGTALVLGKNIVSKVLKVAPTEAVASSARAQAQLLATAQRSLAATAARGAGQAVAVEIPVEVAQQIMQRAQAGQDLMSPEAMASYGDVALGTAQASPGMGAVGNISTRGAARDQIEKTKALENAKAAEAQQAAEAAAAAQKEADQKKPEYVANLDKQYQAFLTKKKDIAAQIVAVPKPAKGDPSAELAYQTSIENLKAQADALQESSKDLITEHAARRGDIEALYKPAQPPAAIEANQAELNNALTQAHAAHADAIKRATDAASSGDFAAAAAAQVEVSSNAARVAALQRLQTPQAAVPPEKGLQALQQRVTTLQRKYAQALRTDDVEARDLHLKELQELMPQLQAAKASAAELAQRQQDMQGQKVGADPANPMAQFMEDSDALDNLPTPLDPAFDTERMDPVREKNTTHQQEQSLFGKADQNAYDLTMPEVDANGNELQRVTRMQGLPPGGRDLNTDPIKVMQEQIAALQNRPNLPAATKAQLENYMRALDNPALSDTTNQQAKNALEIITDNINRIAYRGEGQGAVRRTSQAETDAQIKALNERITQNRLDQSNMLRELREAPPEQQEMQSDVYAASRRRGKELEAQMAELLMSGRQVSLVPYDRDEKQAVAGGKPATETQEKNSKKWIEGAPPRAGDILSPWQLQNSSEEDIAVLQQHLNDEWAKKTKMEQGDADEAARTKSEASHPYKSGQEVMNVNKDPAVQETRETKIVDGERRDIRSETVAPAAQKVNRGLARIERGANETVGVEREGPDDAALRFELQGLSPKDQDTVDMWDDVFGVDSPANRMVNEAEEGLQTTLKAVSKAKSTLEGAKTWLQYATQKLQKAMQNNKAFAPARLLQGQELPQQREVEAAQARVENAKAVAALEADAQRAAHKKHVSELQTQANAAQTTVRAAQEKTATALADFQKEWTRIQKTGKITDGFLEYLNGNTDVASELPKAEQELAEVLSHLPADTAAVTLEMALRRARAQADAISSATKLQALLKKEIPQIRESMGPRVADLVGNVLRIRVAANIIGEAQRLANLHADTVKELDAKQQTFTEKVKLAYEAMARDGVDVSRHDVRIEVLQYEADAQLKKLEDLRAKIEEAVQAVPEVPEQKAVNEAKEKVKVAEKTLAEQQARNPGDLLAAHVNKARAEETRRMLFENEKALREGQRMPLLDEIESLHATNEKIFDKATKDLQDTLEINKYDAADDAADIATLDAHLKGLDALEGQLTALLQDNMYRFQEVQDKVQSMVDANALLSEGGAGEDVDTNAQRVVDRAATTAEIRHLGVEVARTMTQRDTVLGVIDRQLDAISKTDAVGPALEAQRTRLTKTRKDREDFFAKRLGELAERKAALEPERATSPDAAVRGRIVTSLESLRGLQDRMRQQIERISASIDSLQKDRVAAFDKVSAQGASKLETMRRLGLSDREASAPAIRASLLKSLEYQRTEEAKADKKVQDAETAMERARQASLANEDIAYRAQLRNEFIVARNAYRTAVNDRATLHDHLMYLERQQLEAVQKLMQVKEPKKPASAPKDATKYRVGEGAPLVSADAVREGGTKPEGAPTNERALGVVAETLEAGKVKGPEVEQEDDTTAALKDRVQQRLDAVDAADFDSKEGRKMRGKLITELSKELGSLRATFEGIYEKGVEARENTKGEGTITRASMAKSKGLERIPTQSPYARAIGNASANVHTRDRLLPLQDQIRFLEDAITDLKDGRKPSLDSIANSQGRPGRRNPVMKKTTNAGDIRVGKTTPVQGPGWKWNGKEYMPTPSKAMSGTEANATGKRNPPTETRKEEKVTTKQVVTQANKETAKGMGLRLGMERVKLERDVEESITARAAAQERYDAVMAAPKASDAAKANVKEALDAAKEAAAAADAALVEGTKTADITPQSEGDPNGAANVFGEANNGPYLSTEAIAAAHDGRILDVADDLAKNGSTPEIRTEAARLRPLLLRTKLAVDENIQHKGESVAGFYSPEQNKITMHPLGLTELDMIHEMTHAATDAVLLAPIDSLTPEQRKGRVGLEKMWQAASKRADLKGMHGASNVREFAAEVYSNDAFRAKLDTIGKPRTMLDYIKSFFRMLLGQPTPPSGKAKDFIEQILSPSRKTTGVGAPSLFSTPAYSNDLASFGKDLSHNRSVVADLKATGLSKLKMALEQKLIDQRATLRKVSSIGDTLTGTQVKGDLLSADKALQNGMAVMSDGAFTLTKDAKGLFMMKAGGGPNAKAVFDHIAELPGKSAAEKLDLFQAYVTGKRAQDVGWDKLDYNDPVGMQKRYDAAMAKLDPVTKAQLERAQDAYHAFNKGLVQFLKDTNAVPDAIANEMMADRNYIPMFRNRGDSIDMVTKTGKDYVVGDIRRLPFLHALNTGDQKVMPFEESLLKNATMLTNLGVQNMTNQHIAYHMQGLGRSAAGDKKPMQIRRGKGGATDGATTLRFRTKPEDSADDGERHIVLDTAGTAAEHIPTDLLAQAVAGSYHSVPALLGIGKFASDILRAGVTRMPTYVISQTIKDPLNAAMMGNLKADPFTATMKTLNNFQEHLMGNTPEDALLMRHGVLQSQIFSGSTSDVKKMLMQIAGKNQSVYRQALAKLDRVAMSADAATRLQGYRDVIKAGGSELEAVIHAQEMQNFSKRGSSQSIQIISQLVPFFNAQLQGLNVLFKSASGGMPSDKLMKTKEAFFRRALGMTAIALVAAAQLEDDPEWEKLSLYTKLANIPIGNGMHIPAPFESGFMFWSLPIAFMEALKDNFTSNDWADVRRILSNQLPGGGSIMPQAAKGAVDVVRNYNSAFGSPIESVAMQRNAVQERYAANTPEAMKLMSRHLVDMGVNLSPVQISYLANAYLGQLPHMVGLLTNSVFETKSQDKDTGEKPTGTAHDNPLLARFTRNQSESRHVNNAYAIAKKALETSGTVKKMVEDGRKTEAAEYQKEQIAKYGTAQQATAFTNQMGFLTRKIASIKADAKLSADEKQAQIEAVYAKKNDMAKAWLARIEARAP